MQTPFDGAVSSSDEAYNSTYPATPVREIDGETHFAISIIADLDHDSKHKDGYWFSYMLNGTLIRNSTGSTLLGALILAHGWSSLILLCCVLLRRALQGCLGRRAG